MQITSWAYGRRVSYDRTAYLVHEGNVSRPKARTFEVFFDKPTRLAQCVTCGNFDCIHAMHVQQRLRAKGE